MNIQVVVPVPMICFVFGDGGERRLVIPPRPKPIVAVRCRDDTGQEPAAASDDGQLAGVAVTAVRGIGVGVGNLPTGTRVRVVRSYAGGLLPREETRTGETTAFTHGWYYCCMDDGGQV